MSNQFGRVNVPHNMYCVSAAATWLSAGPKKICAADAIASLFETSLSHFATVRYLRFRPGLDSYATPSEPMIRLFGSYATCLFEK